MMTRGLCVLAAACLMSASGCQQPNQYQPPPPPPVKVARPIQKTVKLYLVENGQTEPVDKADVRARLQGFLEEIRFQEGQKVEVGQVLYVIEQREYRAARDSAKADLQIAGVAVERARLEFERQDSLLKENATSKSKWEQARAERDGAEAARDKAQALLDRAELNLEYTEVKANIAGNISETFVKQGNLVEDGTLLATITQYDPIWAKFNISERYVNEFQRQSPGRRQRPEIDLRHIAAELQRDGDQGYPFKGNLTYVDMQGIDPGTGTLMIKAEFSNPQKVILPGNSVRVRVEVGEKEDALLIPERAVGADQVGRYGYVLAADGKVQRRNFVLGPKYGSLVVVDQGLKDDDMVVIDGLQRVRDGSPVTPSTIDLSAEEKSLEIAVHQDPQPAENAGPDPGDEPRVSP
ncbi:MAG: efflux RND transporter periplasmic adaptor subunit [Planctomycetales bacterium]|nr:efflux RND transporter periplasmic adaptor subunit [Planctomycetales bacterium]NIM10107.1 efflux RND transporter periplasmic adaptor subunit [Planctomycetales bacterium]NIO47600.1 efflux RND transporter periplasmic adaptor subunit [Planctomycetales bacterium]